MNFILKIIFFSFHAISSNGLVASSLLEAVVDKDNRSYDTFHEIYNN